MSIVVTSPIAKKRWFRPKTEEIFQNMQRNRVTFAMVLLYYVASVILFAVYHQLTQNEVTTLASVLLSAFAIGIVFLWLYCIEHGVWKPTLCTEAESLSLHRGLPLAVLGSICLYPLGVYSMTLLPYEMTVTAPEGLWQRILLLGIINSILEEIIFRGILYQGLRHNGIVLAMLLSTMLFSLTHLHAAQLLYTFLLGCLCCAVYEATTSFLAPCCCHIAFNCFSLLIEYFQLWHITGTWLLIVALFGTGACVWVLGYFLRAAKRMQPLFRRTKKNRLCNRYAVILYGMLFVTVAYQLLP